MRHVLLEGVWRERLVRYRRSVTVAAGMGVAVALVLAAANAGQAQEDGSDGDQEGFKTQIKPYLKGVEGSGFETEPILSADGLVPETGESGQQYQMVGIPEASELLKRTSRVAGAMTAVRAKARTTMTRTMSHASSRTTSSGRASPRTHAPAGLASRAPLCPSIVLPRTGAFSRGGGPSTLNSRTMSSSTPLIARLAPSAASARALWPTRG